MAAAVRAFAGPWPGDDARRRSALRQMSERTLAAAEEVGRLVCLEQGKPLMQAIGEVMGAAQIFELYARAEVPEEPLRSGAVRTTLVRRPLGVTAAITPWNFPLATLAMKVAPALLVGNTVVAKPSPFTPCSTLALGRLLRDVVPPGVLNVLGGDDALGAAMTAHPATRKIAFTGSIAAGKAIMRAAAADLKRITLELGGNDAAIVLPDVDPTEVAPALFWNAFANSGQICMAIKRLYVHEAVYAPLVDALAEIARGVVVGDGMDPGSQLGPVSTRPQFTRVLALLDGARRAGARMVTGGAALDRPGFFVPPTLVTDVAADLPLVREEQFGPVLPILPYREVDDAIAAANATPYGLCGSVWTRDAGRGAAIARRLECGTAWVNQHLELSPEAPFGGVKWSGIGYENGLWGIDGYCDLQVIQVAG
jgi:acyl-CoA reductase-like NAD-dependent aldehyde dehydrogenase